jgi:hypothetical protein
MYLWADVPVGTATVTASGTTLTASTASFYESMVGLTITITGDESYTITGYTSPTVVTLSAASTASGATFSISSGGDFGLPDDFGALIDRFTWNDQLWYRPLEYVTPERIRQLRTSGTSASADPIYAAINTRAWDSALGTRYDLQVWPTPTTPRALTYRYNRQPQALVNDTDVPWGGPEMASTYMECALAHAELEKNQTPGPHAMRYAMRDPRTGQVTGGLLFQAIERDNMRRSKTLGLNRDRSDEAVRLWRPGLGFYRPVDADTYTYEPGL